jgi:PhzF family phenazine biosynthesis protein
VFSTIDLGPGRKARLGHHPGEIVGYEAVEQVLALQSPATRSAPAGKTLIEDSLALFSYSADELDPRLPPALAEAGARHLVLALSSREKLSAMQYDLEAGHRLMTAAGIVTISLIHAETANLFHTRNPFAAGGVYDDPATGAAAAALAGYLRDLGCVRLTVSSSAASRRPT